MKARDVKDYEFIRMKRAGSTTEIPHVITKPEGYLEIAALSARTSVSMFSSAESCDLVFSC